MCPLSVLLADPETAGELVTAEVKDQELGLHFVDGTFADVLTSGKHAFWKAAGEHRFQLEDASHPEMGESVPAYLFREIPGEFYDTVEVAPYQKARLLFDGKPVRVLEPGIYRFWNGAVQVTTEFFDTRLTQLTVSGQEILTRDKVSLRLNFVWQLPDHGSGPGADGDRRPSGTAPCGGAAGFAGIRRAAHAG